MTVILYILVKCINSEWNYDYLLIHFFPKNIQRKLLRNFTVWGLITRPSKERVEEFLAEIRLLSGDELEDLFPDCEIRREKFLGFTKAFIVLRR